MEHVDSVVIGAGVVGLACARALARRGHEVLVLEALDGIGRETSSRNSEVIHAGIYYPAGSLKAALCVRGRTMLYAFCASHGVAHARCGKLIVATQAQQESELDSLHAHATANGVDDMRWLTRAQVRDLEPEVNCTAALLSPSTGIVDSHALMLAMLGDAETDGAALAIHSRVERGVVTGRGIELEVASPGTEPPMRLCARRVVNAAGLHAWSVAASIEGMPAHAIPPRHLARGNYFQVAGRAPFSHLIYPVPEPGGLGTHLTLDLGGQARFGPDVEWIDHIDYSVDPRRGIRFVDEVRKYWPGLPDGALQPAYSGIRPKLSGPGEAAADFLIQGSVMHGVAGLVNLFGIESPGLTASLAIAKAVTGLLE